MFSHADVFPHEKQLYQSNLNPVEPFTLSYRSCSWCTNFNTKHEINVNCNYLPPSTVQVYFMRTSSVTNCCSTNNFIKTFTETCMLVGGLKRTEAANINLVVHKGKINIGSKYNGTIKKKISRQIVSFDCRESSLKI